MKHSPSPETRIAKSPAPIPPTVRSWLTVARRRLAVGRGSGRVRASRGDMVDVTHGGTASEEIEAHLDLGYKASQPGDLFQFLLHKGPNEGG